MRKITLLLCLLYIGFTPETYAQTTAIPDANFEQALIDLDLDSGSIDGQVTTANISGVLILNVLYENISDLTGIEDFTALTYLDCSGNSIEVLDLSANTALTTLYCSYNSIEVLDLSANTALTTLNCSGPSIEVLNLSANTALTDLRCSATSIQTLDLSTNINLIQVICFNSPIEVLDLSTNTALTTLDCSGTSIETLDLSTNTNLFILGCKDTALTSLNVKNGNNTNILALNATGNPNLACIQVDDVDYSNTKWIFKDATASYSTDCTLSTHDLIKNEINIYPNPVNDILHISLEDFSIELEHVKLYNLQGQLLKEDIGRVFNVSQFASGMYVLEIKTNKGKSTKKIIIE